MKKTKKRKKIEKGEFGYFKSEKKRRLILTAILLGVPLLFLQPCGHIMEQEIPSGQ